MQKSVRDSIRAVAEANHVAHIIQDKKHGPVEGLKVMLQHLPQSWRTSDVDKSVKKLHLAIDAHFDRDHFI